MKKVNLSEVREDEDWSPKRTMGGYGKLLSEALGRKRDSMDLLERHPFDVEIQRIPPGIATCPYHAHSAQWEFYYVLSGTGAIRDESGVTIVGPGDAFLFKPGEAHQIRGEGPGDFVVMCVADNPIGEACFYPDSNKWSVELPEPVILRSEPLDYFDGEE